jgi:hypothetical protein
MAPKTINNAIAVVSAVLNRAARVWRTQAGTPWLRQAPPRLSRLSTKGRQAKPYPLSWDEQDRLFRLLPRHQADAALFAVHTGCREQEICQLRWEWEVDIPELETSVFILPLSLTKTGTERVVMLNSVAQSLGGLPGCRWRPVSSRACIICGTLPGGDCLARVFRLKPVRRCSVMPMVILQRTIRRRNSENCFTLPRRSLTVALPKAPR